MGKYEELGKRIGQLTDKKQAAYGDSFGDSAAFLRLLYPKGIAPEQYGNLLTITRMFDKLKRLATKPDAFGESPFADLAGYSLLGLQKAEEDGEKEKEKP